MLYAWAVNSSCCSNPYSYSPSIGLCENLPLYNPEFIWPHKKVGSKIDVTPPAPRIQLPCPVTAYHVTGISLGKFADHSMLL
jgi:hypothetical protein